MGYRGAPVSLGLAPFGLTSWLGLIPTVATVVPSRAVVVRPRWITYKSSSAHDTTGVTHSNWAQRTAAGHGGKLLAKGTSRR